MNKLFTFAALACFASSLHAQESTFPTIDKVVAGAKTYDGLFKLYQKGDNLYAELMPNQLDRGYMITISFARGGEMFAGHSWNSDEQWVIYFKRVGDRIHLIRKNVRYTPGKGPLARAIQTTYTDSVLKALDIAATNPIRNSVLINLNDIYMTNFADLPFGAFDPRRSSWHQVKAFKKNVELQVSAVFSGGRVTNSVIDYRGNTMILHYGIIELPDTNYKPRFADDRVGYFVTAMKDFNNPSLDTAFVRLVNRWRLERSDDSPWKEGARLVPPKRKIVFWIENSVPVEYRAAVRDGILEWNKAFEKIGFRDAIEVRQQEDEEFDPEDATYSTFRWITTDQSYAMGPSRANPLTGEIIDADIIFDASMVRYYRKEQRVYHTEQGFTRHVDSTIQAARRGWMVLPQATKLAGSWDTRTPMGVNHDDYARIRSLRSGMCQCASHKQSELGLALMAMQMLHNLKPGDPMPDDMVQQAIKETVMHELGHTLGLRHNFKASTMLKNSELHDTSITQKRGLVGSVMDYNPVNIAPKNVKQGDYFTTTLGPYDYWAIEYGYIPLEGGTFGEADALKKIASKSAQPGHDYGTDEDLMNADPFINMWDLGNDPLQYGKERLQFAQEMAKKLSETAVTNGESYQRVTDTFAKVLRQYGDAAFLASQYVGGEAVHRDHKGDPNGRDPFVPVSPAKQREALAFLQSTILNDQTFQFPPELLRKLTTEKWLHWESDENLMRSPHFPLNERILGIQRIAFRELLSDRTLNQIQNVALKTAGDEKPLTAAEVLRSLTDGTYTDAPLPGGKAVASTPIRRNMQRAYQAELKRLALTGSNADARSLARMHLREIDRRMQDRLKEKNLDETTRAHYEDSHEQIAKILAATIVQE
ncbi:MAG: zinc-dependent metalloprotease [Zavarzinella sp.]